VVFALTAVPPSVVAARIKKHTRQVSLATSAEICSTVSKRSACAVTVAPSRCYVLNVTGKSLESSRGILDSDYYNNKEKRMFWTDEAIWGFAIALGSILAVAALQYYWAN
tara:strand:+ start:67 stop:396 length:330 start_codon:yes stop_codon:yes gene_type:complete